MEDDLKTMAVQQHVSYVEVAGLPLLIFAVQHIVDGMQLMIEVMISDSN